MDTLLAGYGSDGESENDQNNENDDVKKDSTESSSTKKDEESSQDNRVQVIVPEVRRPDRRYLQAAPAVSLTAGRRSTTSTALTIPKNKNNASKRKHVENSLILMNNPTKATMYEPVQGPQADDPAKRKSAQGVMQVNMAVDETTFREQRSTFQRTGQAIGAGGDAVVRTTLGYNADRLQQFAKTEQERKLKRPRPEDGGSKKKSKAEIENELVQGSDDEAEYGIWGPPTAEEQLHNDETVTDLQKGELTAEQLAERDYLKERDRQRGKLDEDKEEMSAQERLVERKMKHLLPPRISADKDEPMEASTTFHGKEQVDYKGRSWMAAPPGLGSVIADGKLDVDHHKCHVPKKCVHRFTGHNQGVHRIRLFPLTGHLLLSAGLDGKCKVWSIPEKQVMRTYMGHSAAVRDVQFNHTGDKFVSASFDRYLRLWNTESGQVLQTFCNRKVPYCVAFYPHDDNFFVVGCSDNKIVTYDANTAEITQEYNHHLAPVNAVVFVEDHGTKLVSASDDKKILVWEWDIGVPIKYISDPTMHSMPALVMHPAEQFFVGQSLDNTIAVFQAGGKFALQKKKKFSGHTVSGYACEMAFSPDGKYLVSGDGNGSLFFWDWNKRRILQKYRAHSQGPAACCAWHPLEASTVLTCGWDGIIKMWT